MTAASSRIPEALDKIAARLGVSVETFFDPSDSRALDHAAALLLNPEGRQLAEAFNALPPHMRSALTRTAWILVDLVRDAA